jgi:serine/threonine-protein kinase
MGVVYHAIDPTIGRPVAIKTLRFRDLEDNEQRRRLRERLFREARSAGALSHPGIVTIYDMDESEGLAYIAMEYVDGVSLEDILDRPQPMTRERLIELFRQTAAALDYAHRKGIIHRDIKPANIIIDANGSAKITDFGIAKVTQVDGHTLTGVLIGTPNYMSPEQVQGNEIDGRSDQFSLAVIAYEILTGERPFSGEQISTVVYKIVTAKTVPAETINKTLNEKVDHVLRRGLAKKPERRFQSCTAFVTALEGALDHSRGWRAAPRRAHQHFPEQASAALTKTVDQPAERPSRKTRTPKPEPAPPRKRSSVPLIGAVLAVLAVAALIGWRQGFVEIPGLPTPERAQATAARISTPPEQAAPQLPLPEPAATENRPSPMIGEGDTQQAQSGAAAPTGASQPTNSQPTETQPAEPRRPPQTPGTIQEVNVMTVPAGALATLDGQSETTCQTPCKIRARSGTHSLTFTLDGYQTERREVHIGSEDMDVPLIAMRSSNGMLVLSSDPVGARVVIDGRDTGQVTPVRLSLPAGPHQVTIEKNGVQTTEGVEIRNGDISVLRMSANR